MVKIIVKKAIWRKPNHIYYVDLDGNIGEADGWRNIETFWERIIYKWVDFKRLFGFRYD